MKYHYKYVDECSRGSRLLQKKVSMEKYVAKERKTIYAAQFNPDKGEIPEGVYNVRPWQDTTLGTVKTIQGQEVMVNSGEWIVREPQDPTRHYPVDKDYFAEHYEKG